MAKKKPSNVSFVLHLLEESIDKTSSYELDYRNHVYQVYLQPIYAVRTRSVWNGRSSDELCDTEEIEEDFLKAVKIGITECNGEVTEKNQQNMDKIQKLADELGVTFTIESSSVGFSGLIPNGQQTELTVFSSDTDLDLCNYLESIWKEYGVINMPMKEHINLYVAIHDGMGGKYIEKMWSPAYERVNLQTSVVTFVEGGMQNLLEDKKYDDLVYWVIDLIEEKLCQDGCLDTRYSDFVPQQHK